MQPSIARFFRAAPAAGAGAAALPSAPPRPCSDDEAGAGAAALPGEPPRPCSDDEAGAGAAKLPSDDEQAPPAAKRTKPSLPATDWHTLFDGAVLRLPPAAGAAAPGAPVLAMDMDGTLIDKLRPRESFNAEAGNWRWLFPEVPARLAHEHAAGRRLVVLSNQSPKARSRERIEALVDELAAALAPTPVEWLFAVRHDRFRKPGAGLWRELLARESDAAAAVYVGDAAGRRKAPGRRADHGHSDRTMAINAGLAFQTPEAFFLGRPDDPPLPPLPPRPERGAGSGRGVLALAREALLPPPTAVELLVLVGSPAAGKTTLATRLLGPAGYAHVNQDELGSRKACERAARRHLEAGRPVVVDNTSRDARTRAVWVALAAEAGVPARCLHLQTTAEESLHINAWRALQGGRFVKKLVVYSYFKNFEPVGDAEGFAAVVTVPFEPEPDAPDGFYEWLPRPPGG